ncbi:indole-3-acetic acid-amido synthetase GH3.6-like [Solanum stenotomum]|uniref:indole-3-acetic acid-amido synthetase GH3.6-like n=1 Tax=Solanum stenotomum TaxID=172797 RepID=UPI0020D15D9E|nr:indole-3-acetic acid-amido synthetase GH3.6-like [Solanum stenotomum]
MYSTGKPSVAADESSGAADDASVAINDLSVGRNFWFSPSLTWYCNMYPTGNLSVAIDELPVGSLLNMEGNMTEENKKNLEFIEEVTRNVDEVQKRVLNEILPRNANVEYLQRLNLNGHTDRETFKKVVPIITYEDIQSDINRIANGNRSPILCSQLKSEFFTSSGMSGRERKLIPTTEEENGRRHQLYGLMMSVVCQFFLDLGIGKGMYFMFIKSEAKTPGGLLARPILTSVYKSSHFKNSTPYTSPIKAILCLDSYESMYSQMLCSLCQNREVVRVGSIFASAFIRAMRFLEDHWSLLCNDIRT